MDPHLPVAVIGAGPAGATLARLLAEGGREAVLVDERGPHEKVCGGGVTVRGWRGRPVLEDDLATRRCSVVRRALVEADGERVEVALAEPVRIYPRLELNRIFFDAALGAGSRFVRARATGIARSGGGFRVELAGTPPLEAAFVAGADGAAGIARKLLGGGRGRGRFVLAVGHHAERGTGDGGLYINFPRGHPGYVWVFPRPDHLSVGICSRDPAASPRELRALLARALSSAGVAPRAIRGSEYAFPIPDYRAFEGPRAGPGWALIGDAGGFVDPITLEGISYAIRSGELLAAAILAGAPERFEGLWRADFGRELARAAHHVDRFYSNGFPSRMVRSSAHYPRLGRLLGGLLSGAVPYRGLRGRAFRAFVADRASRLFLGAARSRQSSGGARTTMRGQGSKP